MARDCYMTCLKPTVQHHRNETPVATITGSERLAEVDLKIGDKKVLIGKDLSPTIEANLLNVDPSYTPVQQKQRKFATERNKIINDEVERLIKADMIKEVDYPEWLANVVIVQKKNGKWRVCVDYTNLNKTCPKYPYPSPHIETMVDSTAGHELLTFLDVSSGFNQIQMEPSDCEKTAFITDRGIYCYLAMSFGLRNVGATFQRLVNKIFKDQIGQTMEVYIDDMVVKSVSVENHVRDLQEVFDILRSYNMKLNPSKLSGVLVKENEGVQSPVYYVSKSVANAETRYTSLEKLVLALAMTFIKLRHYFESHKIHVMTNFPLRNVLSKPDLTGRMVKWAIRLSTYDVTYDTRTVIKSQVLADFVADFSPSQMTDVEQEFQQVLSRVDMKRWTLYTDGASNVNGTGLGLVLKSPQGDMIAQSM
ncbi:uncharacterized protein LOC141661310 [Apium graveolens]|uniref:uncharacterized protein LOC141661310 n=1 Tax=Apium graveolens TaxID=4045 RepID=UPI003D7A20D1